MYTIFANLNNLYKRGVPIRFAMRTPYLFNIYLLNVVGCEELIGIQITDGGY